MINWFDYEPSWWSACWSTSRKPVCEYTCTSSFYLTSTSDVSVRLIQTTCLCSLTNESRDILTSGAIAAIRTSKRETPCRPRSRHWAWLSFPLVHNEPTHCCWLKNPRRWLFRWITESWQKWHHNMWWTHQTTWIATKMPDGVSRTPWHTVKLSRVHGVVSQLQSLPQRRVTGYGCQRCLCCLWWSAPSASSFNARRNRLSWWQCRLQHKCWQVLPSLGSRFGLSQREEYKDMP